MILDLKDFLKDNSVYKQYINSVKPESLKTKDFIILTDDVLCTVDIYITDDNLYGEVKLVYKYIENCARCLDEFNHQVETEFKITIGEVFNEDELSIDLVDDKIDLTDAIVQSIYVSKPIKVLCKNDCKGICQKCGINRNHSKCNRGDAIVDPRLDKLRKLLDKEV